MMNMMKRQHEQSKWTHRVWRGRLRAAGIGVLGAVAVAASGCDTVALISFSQRSFTDIHTSGFTPPQSGLGDSQECAAVDSTGDMRLRFVLADDSGRPIQKGDAIDNVSVELSGDSIAINNSALMMPADGPTCADNSSCPTTNFTCQQGPGLDGTNAPKRCLLEDRNLGVADTAEQVQFVATTDQDQVFGVLMEATGSLEGYNPPGSGGYWDRNSNGTTGDSEDGSKNSVKLPGIATDDDEARGGAVLQTEDPWGEAQSVAEQQGGRETFFGLWEFNDTSENPKSYVTEVAGDGTQWTRKSNNVGSAISSYYNATHPLAGTDIKNYRANVYEATKSLIETKYTDSAMADINARRPDSVDKELVVFVDGYDDLREDDGVTVDQVISAARTNNVRVFVVHLDPRLETPEQLREDPNYPIGQDPCTDDTACKNYETCRKPRGYSDAKGGPVSVPRDAYAYDEEYCLPDRDEHGRTGPIADYARLACATGGGYMYVASPRLLAENMRWLPLVLDGLWEAKVNSNSISRGRVPGGRALRVQTDVQISAAGTKQTYSFSQIGGKGNGSGSSADDFDTRGTIFTADE